MYTLLPGYNAIRWLGPPTLIAASGCAAVVALAYRQNPVTGFGTISYQALDGLSTLQSFDTGIDYLVLATGDFFIATDAGPATSGAFADFPGYTPPVADTAPILPVGRTETGIAAEPIIGGRLVAQTLVGLRHYSSDLLEHQHLLFGIALNSALKGGSVSVRRPGFVNYDGWGLPPNTTMVAGADGRLVTSVSATSFYQIIGRSLDSNSFIYQPETIILLSNPQTLLQDGN